MWHLCLDHIGHIAHRPKSRSCYVALMLGLNIVHVPHKLGLDNNHMAFKPCGTKA